MRTVSGSGGSVYSLGEPFGFSDVPLRDCGGGWDWCTPEDMRCWEDVVFEVWDGEWIPVKPLHVYPRSGVVSFNRCFEGKHVRASGTAYTTSLIGVGESWRIEVDTAVSNTSVLGSDVTHTTSKTLRSRAVIDGITGEPGRVFARLPSAIRGVFVGLGQLVPGLDSVSVIFDDEGVLYESA